ncbi:hypothetical protein AAC387_Pa07g3667 [Persea americana]
MGCIGNLYETIINLSNTYIQPGLDKNMLLNPKSLSLPYGQDSLLLQNDATPNSMKFYLCCNCQVNVTDVRGVACPSCKHGMTTEKTFVAENTGLSILKASLHSKTVLTDIFLGSGMKKA